MGAMKITLPDTLMPFVEAQVKAQGHGTRSAYVCALIRRDQDRLQLRDLLIAGAASLPAGPADGAYFQGLRDRLQGAAKRDTGSQ